MTRALLAALALAAAPAGDPVGPLERFDRPPSVTAAFQDEPLAKAVAELCRRAGCAAIPVAGGTEPVTLELKDVPFWTAVDRVLDGAGYHLRGSEFEALSGMAHGSGVSDPLQAAKRPDGLRRAPACVAGPARVSLVAVVAERSGKAVHRYSPEAEEPEEARTTLRVGLKFTVVEGLETAEGVLVRVDSAVDEKGRKLVVLPADSGGHHGPGGIAGERWIRFEGAGVGETVAVLAGAMVVRIPRAEAGSNIHLDLDLPLDALPAKAVLGGATLTVTAAGEGTLRIQVKGSLFPPEPGVETALPEILFEEEGKGGRAVLPAGTVGLRVRDATGRDVPCGGWSASGDGETMTYDCPMEGKPAKISVRACTAVDRREIPFRFADIALPK